ncbi:hypothetical protein FORC58_0471 [Salmonella enterica subsp. enterica serovar Typhimurium]|nr:hypothetical protein DC51_3488 [Salmonella enterica subsp. enterica serovar Typhimurium]AVU69424.1 hypothetical protein FORC58_0471 [Salmonella enterica subsp. enterica serovar Typhimurium]EFX50244.1 plasma membrane calcium-transporting ATPase 3-like isoform 1 [Salmonella enterica subsp. enterica serovar Typhimurium str. TN061786]VXG74064.1 FIG01045506: hypothetical protein CDS [Salmonella enterica subsp. enterica serovar Derby]
MQLELVFSWCYLINQRFAKYSNVMLALTAAKTRVILPPQKKWPT